MSNIAPRDENYRPALVWVDSTDNTKVVVVKVNPATWAVKAKII